MRNTLLVPVVIIAVGGCAGGGASPGTSPAPSAQPEAVTSGTDYSASTSRAASTIRPAQIQEHIEYLASDELAGRDTPSPGLELAAEYLAGESIKRKEFRRVRILHRFYPGGGMAGKVVIAAAGAVRANMLDEALGLVAYAGDEMDRRDDMVLVALSLSIKPASSSL